MDSVYENYTINTHISTGSSTPNHSQNEENTQKLRGRVCLVWMTVSLGLICVLLLVFIIRMNIIITAEREEHETTVQEFNHTINRLKTNYTDLRTERDQLQKNFDDLRQKNQELEISVLSLSAELAKNKQNWLFLSTEAKSWSGIRQFCRDRGGDLVTIKTEEKQRFLTSLVQDRVWIGLTDVQQEGLMTWVDNSRMIQRFWMYGEPNDPYGMKDCVEMMPFVSYSLNNWREASCSEMKKGICEK